MTIRERHGLGGLATTNASFDRGGGESVTVTDSDGWVCINVSAHPLRMTPSEARFLADVLVGSADRVERDTNEKIAPLVRVNGK